MTGWELLGGAGLIIFVLACWVLAIIVNARLAVRLGAWWRARRAATAFGPETASAHEDRAARTLGYATRRRP